MAAGAPKAPIEKVSLAADGQVGMAGPCVYFGYIVTNTLAAFVCNVRDTTVADAGDIVDIIAASAPIGTKNMLPNGVLCPNGVYADFGGVGTVTFFYRQA